jgi:hypothetical protein
MKKFLLFLMLGFVITNAIGQALISPINITLPANPSANTADWGVGTNIFVISAQTRPVNGQINGNVQESKILVTIKKGSAKVCGTYTDATAPSTNFNAPTKTWTGANAASLLGNTCTLTPGDYMLCVKFIAPFSTVNLGEEVCKPFTIRDVATPGNPTTPTVSQNKFTPPTNLAPINGAQLKPEDAKKPLIFRWTPIVPKPQGVVYKLKVWQLKNEQTATAAIKSNTPIIDKEIKEITQFVKPNLMGDIEMVNNKAALVWNVQAINEQGAVLGSSEPTNFMVSSGGCIIDYTPCRIDSIICKENNQYKVCATFFVTKSGFGSSSTSYTAYPTKIIQAQFFDQSFNPIGTAIPININKNEGQSYQICQTITIPTTTTTLKIKFDAQVQTPNTVFDNCVGTANAEMQVPSCKCTTCEQVEWKLPESIKFDTSGIRATNNIMTLYGGLSFGPQKPVKVTAEITNFYWYSEGDCKKCTNNDYYFGNLVSGKLGTILGTSPNDDNGVPIPSSHQLDFIFNNLNGVTVNNMPVNLNISVPKQTSLSCCTDCFRFCIRYTAIFMENGVCKTCTIVKCYETKRKHNKVGMVLNYPVNQCGDINILSDTQNAIDLKK